VKGGVWTDVVRMQTLNSLQSASGREKHVCPLQFDIIDRLVRFYSEPGEVVFDPFMGIGSVPYRALKLGRQRARALSCTAGYWADACGYLSAMEQEVTSPSLFDLMGLNAREAAA
jgi:hypothetical protein